MNTSDKTYTVKGMTCAHCELSVREQVEKLAGVDSANADHTTGKLTVTGDAVYDDAVRAAVQISGYRSRRDGTERIMSVATRLTGFAALLGLAFGGAGARRRGHRPDGRAPARQHGGGGGRRPARSRRTLRTRRPPSAPRE